MFGSITCRGRVLPVRFIFEAWFHRNRKFEEKKMFEVSRKLDSSNYAAFLLSTISILRNKSLNASLPTQRPHQFVLNERYRNKIFKFIAMKFLPKLLYKKRNYGPLGKPPSPQVTRIPSA